jgi:hypothetical protein
MLRNVVKHTDKDERMPWSLVNEDELRLLQSSLRDPALMQIKKDIGNVQP